MQRLTKPYVYILAAVSSFCLWYFITNHSPVFNLPVVIFVLITIFLEYNDIIVNDSTAISLTSCSSVFLTMFFGIYPPIIASCIGIILVSTVKYREQIRIRDLKESESKKAVRHGDLWIKTTFNISKEIIETSIIFFLYISLKVNFMSEVDMWKVALISAVQIALDIVMLCLAISFNMGRWYRFSPFNRRTIVYMFSNIVLSIMLSYSYRNIGLAGVLLVYSIALPLQRATSLYYKISSQEKEMFIDELTQAYNLRFFKDVLGSKIAQKEPFALIMIDLNSFKFINDTYGHLAGNKVLEDFSKIVRQKLVKDNYFCRYGGDEFVIVVNDENGAPLIASDIIGYLDQYEFEFNENRFKLPLSLGIYDDMDFECDNVSSIIEKADKAMYCAKNMGNNIIVNYRDMR